MNTPHTDTIEKKIRNIGSMLLDEVNEERYGMQKHHAPEDIPQWFVNDVLKALTQAREEERERAVRIVEEMMEDSNTGDQSQEI